MKKRLFLRLICFLMAIVLFIGGYCWLTRPEEVLQDVDGNISVQVLYFFSRDDLVNPTADLLDSKVVVFSIPMDAPVYREMKALLSGLRARHRITWAPFVPDDTVHSTVELKISSAVGKGLEIGCENDKTLGEPALTITHWAGMTREKWFEAFYDLLRQSEEYMV